MAKRVKLDEDLSPLVGQPLLDIGHQVLTVLQQGWGGMLDEDLYPKLVAERVFFVTGDRGFGDIRAYPPGEHEGILVLRPERESIINYRDLLAATLRAHALDELEGCIVIASPAGIRIRRPSGRS